MRHVDGVSTKPCCHRPTKPARAAPRHGASQKSQSWLIYAPPANSAGPVLRAGLTDAFVTGIRVRRNTVSVEAHSVQQAGLIQYRRGHITILNRDGLEECACECCAVIRAETDKLMGTGLKTGEGVGNPGSSWPPEDHAALCAQKPPTKCSTNERRADGALSPTFLRTFYLP
jgi:hypothetical protein